MVDAKLNLQVWHIPQLPSPTFYVKVDTIREAVKVMHMLANYDSFQFENRIKPAYCNAQGLYMRDDESDDDSWIDFEIDDPMLGYYDDPEEYLNQYDMLEEG